MRWSDLLNIDIVNIIDIFYIVDIIEFVDIFDIVFIVVIVDMVDVVDIVDIMWFLAKSKAWVSFALPGAPCRLSAFAPQCRLYFYASNSQTWQHRKQQYHHKDPLRL